MNIDIDEEIAPEIARAIIAQATLRALSVNDYLRQLLRLNGGQAQEPPFAERWLKEPLTQPLIRKPFMISA